MSSVHSYPLPLNQDTAIAAAHMNAEIRNDRCIASTKEEYVDGMRLSRLPITRAIEVMAIPMQIIIPDCLITATIAEAAARSSGQTEDIIVAVLGALNTAFPIPKRPRVTTTSGRFIVTGITIISRTPMVVSPIPAVGSILLSFILSWSLPKYAVKAT